MGPAAKSKHIRVLVVDDSAVVRSLLTKLLDNDPEITVVGSAADPFIARDKLVSLAPDVMTLDVEMPRMDGLTFLGKVMQHFPTRTIVISSLTIERSQLALRALELGAVDVVAKPKLDLSRSLTEMGQELVDKVKAAAQARLPAAAGLKTPATAKAAPPRSPGAHAPSLTTAAIPSLAQTTHRVLAIAASTGGTEALKVVLGGLPADIPGTVVVQHMPPVFTQVYADTLSRLLPFAVKEAVDGDRVLPGQVLLAPGNFHMELSRSGAYYYVTLNQRAPLHGVRPAADILLQSVAKYAGANAVGVVLTGMGKDAAAGLLSMKDAGAHNIAQDEASCVVFGMPKAAIGLGAIHQVLDVGAIAPAILKRLALM